MIRDLDIKIATLLGHYRVTINGNRGIYNTGSMAMAIFSKSVNEKHIFDDEGNRCWWKSESYIGDGNEMWYTAAVPLYQTDLLESFKLLATLKDEVDIAIYNISDNWNVKLKRKDSNLTFDSIKPTVQEAICYAFIGYMEWKNGN